MTGAGPANAAWTPGGGQIGIVDTNTTTAGTQGATALTPGQSGQAVADVQMLVPNSCSNNDTISLDLRDSTADPNLNVDAAHRLAFSSAPTITVDPAPYTPVSKIGPTSAGTVLTHDTTAGAATTAPVLGATLGSSATGHGANDEATLKNTAACTGTAPTDLWLVTVSGIKVDVGASIAAGPVHVVPSAKDAGTTSVALFGAGAYTVPGYVMPASIAVGAPSSITADGSSQAIGDITVTELTPAAFSPAGATYTVAISGATVKNDATNKVTATVTTGANGESIVATDVTTTASTVSFKLTQTDPTSSNVNLTTVKLSGVLLASNTNSPITYTLHSASIDAALTSPGAPANQTDIVAPKITATGTSLTVGDRIGGSNRYATAAQVALENSGAGSRAPVVLASGEQFPDALSSGFLVQRLNLTGPTASILLARANSLPTATEQALRQLDTRKVYVVGGTAAISDAVLNQVKGIADDNAGTFGTATVTRLAGHNRYDTNKVVNDAASNIGSDGIGTTQVTFGQASKTTALLATGEDSADALASTPATLGANNPIPLVLTRSDALSQQASDQLSSFGVKQVVIAGGTAAVSSAIESGLTSQSIAVKRLSGGNRYQTAIAIAKFELDGATPTGAGDEGGLGFGGDNPYLANGLVFADALAGGPLAANDESPILLTTSTPLQPDVQTYLTDNKSSFDGVTALGLEAAVSAAALNAAQAAIL